MSTNEATIEHFAGAFPAISKTWIRECSAVRRTTKLFDISAEFTEAVEAVEAVEAAATAVAHNDDDDTHNFFSWRPPRFEAHHFTMGTFDVPICNHPIHMIPPSNEEGRHAIIHYFRNIVACSRCERLGSDVMPWGTATATAIVTPDCMRRMGVLLYGLLSKKAIPSPEVVVSFGGGNRGVLCVRLSFERAGRNQILSFDGGPMVEFDDPWRISPTSSYDEETIRATPPSEITPRAFVEALWYLTVSSPTPTMTSLQLVRSSPGSSNVRPIDAVQCPPFVVDNHDGLHSHQRDAIHRMLEIEASPNSVVFDAGDVWLIPMLRRAVLKSEVADRGIVSGGIREAPVGAGKTLEALSLVAASREAQLQWILEGGGSEEEEEEGERRRAGTLILVSSRHKRQWMLEMDTESIHAHDCRDAKDVNDYHRIQSSDIVIATGRGRATLEALSRGFVWYRVIVDEAHTLCRGAATLQRMSSLRTRHWWSLTANASVSLAAMLTLAGIPVESADEDRFRARAHQRHSPGAYFGTLLRAAGLQCLIVRHREADLGETIRRPRSSMVTVDVFAGDIGNNDDQLVSVVALAVRYARTIAEGGNKRERHAIANLVLRCMGGERLRDAAINWLTDIIQGRERERERHPTAAGTNPSHAAWTRMTTHEAIEWAKENRLDHSVEWLKNIEDGNADRCPICFETLRGAGTVEDEEQEDATAVWNRGCGHGMCAACQRSVTTRCPECRMPIRTNTLTTIVATIVTEMNDTQATDTDVVEMQIECDEMQVEQQEVVQQEVEQQEVVQQEVEQQEVVQQEVVQQEVASSSLRKKIDHIRPLIDRGERCIIFTQFSSVAEAVAKELGIVAVTSNLSISKRSELLLAFAERPRRVPQHRDSSSSFMSVSKRGKRGRTGERERGMTTEMEIDTEAELGTEIGTEIGTERIAMVCTLACAGDGFNLTRARHVVFMEPVRARHAFTQAIGRVVRHGNRHEDVLISILCGSIAEHRLWDIILQMTEGDRRIADAAIYRTLEHSPL